MSHKNKLVTLVLCAVFALLALQTSAKNQNVIYRHRTAWVKLVKLSAKQLAGQQLQHPNTALTPDQIKQMMATIKLNKKHVLKKEIVTQNVFDDSEVNKFAPLIAQGLMQAGPDQVVNVAVTHDRSKSIMRNDYISIFNVFVAGDGVHVHFDKLFAKLKDDYQQASVMDDAIRKAKGLRVSLESTEAGVVLLEGVDELVFEPSWLTTHHSGLSAVAEAPATLEQTTTPSTPSAKNAPIIQQNNSSPSDTASVRPATERLSDLKALYDKGLISKSEYETKRKQILAEI